MAPKVQAKARCKFCKNIVSAFDTQSIRYHLDTTDATPCPGVEYRPRCSNVNCAEVPSTFITMDEVDYLVCAEHTKKLTIPNAELVS